ncbi:IS3 family transposase [Neomoorella thermoacetica]|uniref:IS3 family transposase n=1 Tax=Neomoorella thermoacetica TaxID=1525 RepID=UPI0030CAA9BA
MGDSRRKYDEEFKRNAVELCRTSGKTTSQIARDLGINSSMLNRWRREQVKYGERAFPGIGKQMRGTDLEEENRRLKKELAIAEEERDILKKAGGHLLQNAEMKYRFIREHTGTFRVETMCRVLKVSRTGYYRWLKRPVSQRRSQDEIIKEKILNIYNKSRKTYGSPRIQKQLGREGIHCSKKRVERLMREAGVQAIQKRKFKVTTDSRHNLPVAENILNREFTASSPNKRWVTDITYIPTEEGWLYLAAVMDLYSKRIAGYSMQKYLTRELVIEALQKAVTNRRPGRGLVIHSDRGSQYASSDYQQLLRQYGFICSMSRKGDCWDNSPMESFFKTFKTELVYHRRFKTRAEAKLEIFEYIEVFYNRFRLHSALGYETPEEFEKNYENLIKVA